VNRKLKKEMMKSKKINEKARTTNKKAFKAFKARSSFLIAGL
jgi:hypothetical protein